MKRTLTALLIILSLSLAACGTTVPDSTQPSDTEGSSASESSTPLPSETKSTETDSPITTSPPSNTILYPIGNLSFTLEKDTEVSVKSTVYSFSVVPGEAFLLVRLVDVSDLSVSSIDGFTSLAQKNMVDDYDKIGASEVSMNVAGFTATGEIFSVQEDGHLYQYHVMSFSDTYYVYTFMYMTRSDVSDAVECTLAYADLISEIKYSGSSPRT